ncbi:MAG: hypothetical protein IPP17_21915 [Bacteroidetes bacterium]|nr:hypothetical protein [Bacteroidota bacterium]
MADAKGFVLSTELKRQAMNPTIPTTNMGPSTSGNISLRSSPVFESKSLLKFLS